MMRRMKNGLQLLIVGLMAFGLLTGRAHAAPFDQAFIDAMVPHHQSATMMAKLAVTKARHPQLRSLARKMMRDQQKEIAQLKAWRRAWYGSAEVPMNHGAMNHATGDKMTMPGEMMGLPMRGEMDMGKLRAARGNAFDKLFLRMMVPHHAGAIMMADEALKVTARPEIRRLSHRIIDSQAEEIGTMRAWHRRWFGPM